jgi:hypothetical protein
MLSAIPHPPQISATPTISGKAGKTMKETTNPRAKFSKVVMLAVSLAGAGAGAGAGCGPLDSAPNSTDGEAADWLDEDGELGDLTQELVTINGFTSINGMTTENGFQTKNGLIALSGLTTTNGLTVLNGVTVINGLATRKGVTTFNGLYVDCTGKLPEQCGGRPDGLLHPATGLLKKDATDAIPGLMTAQYLVRCTLAKGDLITVRDGNSVLNQLPGEIGVAPGWKTGTCDAVCQQKVSACMLALINQNGVHRKINLTSGWPENPFGTEHVDYPVMESTFFGNIFKTPVEAYVVSGNDHTRTVKKYADSGLKSRRSLQLRSCSAHYADTYPEFLAEAGRCSVLNIGTSNTAAQAWPDLQNDPTKVDKCSFAEGSPDTGGTPSACSGPGTSERNYLYTVTSWRTENPWIYVPL